MTTWIELIANGKILRFGAIAQLGERVNGIHEVGSSILPGSTNFFIMLYGAKIWMYLVGKRQLKD